jgi:hypothetical protein
VGHIKQKTEENQRLEEEIKHRPAILKSTDVEMETINEYKQLKAELVNIISPLMTLKGF